MVIADITVGLRASALVLLAVLVAAGAAMLVGRIIRHGVSLWLRPSRDRAHKVLIAILAGEGSLDRRDHGRRQRRALVEAAVPMLAKVRGSAALSLVAALEEIGTIADARRMTHSRRPSQRAAGVELLGRTGSTTAIAAVLVALHDRDQVVRVVATRALGRLAHPLGTLAVLEALDGERSIPPEAAAMALSRLGDAAVPSMRAALGGGGERARAVAASVLGRLGAVGARDELVVCALTDPSPVVRQAAEAALNRFGSRPPAVDLLV